MTSTAGASAVRMGCAAGAGRRDSRRRQRCLPSVVRSSVVSKVYFSPTVPH
ncbi:MAG: hypothetical protein ACYCS2_11595 [Acidimicrobiales bacterium]